MRIPDNKAAHIGSENPIKTSKLRAIWVGNSGVSGSTGESSASTAAYTAAAAAYAAAYTAAAPTT